MVRFSSILALVVVGLMVLSACEKDKPAPWDIAPTGPGQIETRDTVIKRYYRLSESLLSPNIFDQGQALVPVMDSSYPVVGEDSLFHKASGFRDYFGDTAFITRSFYMDTNEVSKGEWATVMNDYSDTTPSNWPKTNISWFDAIRYCVRKSHLENKTSCYDTSNWKPDVFNYVAPILNLDSTGYRLPTEDEWEYVSRVGNRNLEYGTSDGQLTLAKANYANNANLLFKNNFSWVQNVYGASYRLRLTNDTLRVTQILPVGVTQYNRDIAVSSSKGGYGDFFLDSVYFVKTVRQNPRTNISFQYSFLNRKDSINFLDTQIVKLRALDSVVPDSHTLKYDSRELISKGVYDTLWEETLLRFYTDKLIYYAKRQPVSGDTVFDTLETKWYYQGTRFVSRKPTLSSPIDFTGPIGWLYNDPPGPRPWKKYVKNASKEDINEIENKNNRTFKDTLAFADSSVLIREAVYSSRKITDSTKTDSIFIMTHFEKKSVRVKGSYEQPALYPVASLPSNPYRIHDLSGNANEWCWDAYLKEASRGFRINYLSSVNANTRVRRGGDYSCDGSISESYLRSGTRNPVVPWQKSSPMGFRTVRKAP